jgi:hypothetical protein
MVKRLPFALIYDPGTRSHLSAIEKRYHSLIRDVVLEQLTHEPLTETRNRKPLVRDADLGAKWELRFGPNNCFRVFYSVFADCREVHVLAIGIKLGSRLFVADEETSL